MAKFKIGQKVILIEDYDHLKSGNIGWSLDDDDFPCVNWDTPNEENYPHMEYNNVYAVHEDNLEIYLDNKEQYEIY